MVLNLLLAEPEKLYVVRRISEDLTASRIFVDIGASMDGGSMDVDTEHALMGLLPWYVQIKNLVLVIVAIHLHGLVLDEGLVLLSVEPKPPGSTVLAWTEDGGSLDVHGILAPVRARVAGNVPVPHSPLPTDSIDAEHVIVELVRMAGRSTDPNDVEVVLVSGEDTIPFRLDTTKNAGNMMSHYFFLM